MQFYWFLFYYFIFIYSKLLKKLLCFRIRLNFFLRIYFLQDRCLIYSSELIRYSKMFESIILILLNQNFFPIIFSYDSLRLLSLIKNIIIKKFLLFGKFTSLFFNKMYSGAIDDIMWKSTTRYSFIVENSLLLQHFLLNFTKFLVLFEILIYTLYKFVLVKIMSYS
jgi:hypothetical protein